MKKQPESRLSIKRINTSPYFAPGFNQKESDSLEHYVDMLSADSDESADILITNTHVNFDLLSVEQIKKLKLIVHANSGYDNFPVDFVKGSKAPIVVGSTIRAQAVAQYIISALTGRYSHLPLHKEWDYDRKWNRTLLSELKVTLIGFGHIGKILNSFLSPIVKELVIYDPFENLTQINHRGSDVVILACGLNSKSRNMIDKNFLNGLKENATIINAARGELVVTNDLVNFLTANDDAFAVLDVFEKEPNNFFSFKALKNIITTSHIAGVFKNIDQHTIDFEVEVVRDFLDLTDFDFRNKYQKMILQNKLRPEIGLI